MQFSPWPAIPEPVTVAIGQIKEPRRIDLQEAIALGLLTADVRGVSLESIEVEVSLKVEDSIELTIQPGTTFLAPSPDLQTMVVRHELYIFLEDKDEVSLEVDVACANMHLEAPEWRRSLLGQDRAAYGRIAQADGLASFRTPPSGCSSSPSGQSQITRLAVNTSV